MNSVINESNLNTANEQGQHYETQDNFNCWGATLYVLNKIGYLEWSSQKKITNFIYDDTFTVDDIKKGDIFVLYSNGKIIHTAVYTGKNILFHKRGGSTSEFVSEDRVKCIYDEYDKYEIRRLKTEDK